MTHFQRDRPVGTGLATVEVMPTAPRCLSSVLCALVATTLGGLAACTIDSPTYITSTEAAATDADAGPAASPAAPGSNAPPAGGADGGSTCTAGTFAKPDLSTLTACGDGKGHCFDKTKTPLADTLVACADASMVCVPDDILTAGGATPKSCTSIIGPGGCVTASLFPEIVKQGGSSLKPDVCTGGQVCVPCKDPTHGNAPTPFCQPIGVRTASCATSSSASGADAAPPPAAPACCTTNGKSNGVCLPENVVPASQRDQTKQDTCTAGNKCLPAAFVSGNPVKCSTTSGAGVCMDGCFNDMMKFAGDIGLLSHTGCGTTELCIPCSDLSGQGVPGCP